MSFELSFRLRKVYLPYYSTPHYKYQENLVCIYKPLDEDIEIKDMDSNLVHNRDVSKRILNKLDSMISRIGC